MKSFVLFLVGLLLLAAACRTPPNDELRVTRTEATTVHNDATGLGYGPCLIPPVGRDNAGLVEVKSHRLLGRSPAAWNHSVPVQLEGNRICTRNSRIKEELRRFKQTRILHNRGEGN
jgi:hypothetical protein